MALRFHSISSGFPRYLSYYLQGKERELEEGSGLFYFPIGCQQFLARELWTWKVLVRSLDNSVLNEVFA